MLASLLVSMLLVGIKVTAAKEIVQIIERVKELKANLALLRRRLEEEDLADWLDDIVHDTRQRQERIEAMGPASNQAYTTAEGVVIEKGVAMFSQYDRSSAVVTQLKRSAAVARSETKLEEGGRLLLGRAEVEVWAEPEAIIAYLLNFDGRHFQSGKNPAVDIRSEVVSRVSDHHTIIFIRTRPGSGLADRTWLISMIAKKVAAEPPTYVLVAAPIESHPKIRAQDEKRAVRAENHRAFRCTEVAPGRSKLEYVTTVDFKGRVPQFISNMLALPRIMSIPKSIHLYFTQLRPLSKCVAEDGRVVGHLLMEWIERRPDDLAYTIRKFVNRTAMLRECGFRMGAFLVALICSSRRAEIASQVATTSQDFASIGLVTEEQAAAIGRTLAAAIGQPPGAAALQKAVESNPVLHAMQSAHAWLIPMLTVVVGAHEGGKPRRSTITKRVSSILAAGVTNSDVAPTDAESSFSVVVRLGAHSASTGSFLRALVQMCRHPEPAPHGPLKLYRATRQVPAAREVAAPEEIVAAESAGALALGLTFRDSRRVRSDSEVTEERSESLCASAIELFVRVCAGSREPRHRPLASTGVVKRRPAPLARRARLVGGCRRCQLRPGTPRFAYTGIMRSNEYYAVTLLGSHRVV